MKLDVPGVTEARRVEWDIGQSVGTRMKIVTWNANSIHSRL